LIASGAAPDVYRRSNVADDEAQRRRSDASKATAKNGKVSDGQEKSVLNTLLLPIALACPPVVGGARASDASEASKTSDISGNYHPSFQTLHVLLTPFSSAIL
jgi:hypothetical protein